MVGPSFYQNRIKTDLLEPSGVIGSRCPKTVEEQRTQEEVKEETIFVLHMQVVPGPGFETRPARVKEV
jgi:hypothetical protein